MTGFLSALAVFAFVLWSFGAYDKYSELAGPLFFLYIAAISPLYWTGKEDYERRWKELDKRRRKAMKPGEVTKEELKIGEEMDKLAYYNTPLTVGHLNEFRDELNGRLDSLYSEVRRLSSQMVDND